MRLRSASAIHRRWRRAAANWGLLVVCAGVATGCSDNTDPNLPPGGGTGLTVTVAVTAVTPPTYSASPDGVALISCDASLKATGQGPDVASWREAVFRWYPAGNFATPFDSAVVTAQEVAQSWGNGSILTGPPQLSAWHFIATIPFSVTLEYRYRQEDGSVGVAAPAQFTCQPPVPANPALPVISGLTVVPASGIIEPGDTLSIAFAVDAPAGLWQTLVAITGACDTLLFVPGQLRSAATETVKFPLTRACALGASLGMTVQVLDAALQLRTVAPTLQLTVGDQTPPSLNVQWNNFVRSVSGDFFVGDTIQFLASLFENHVAASVTWEVQPGGTRDSLQAVPDATQFMLGVTVRASWVAPLLLSFVATDVSGNASAPAMITGDSVLLYPDAPRPTATRPVAGETTDLRADPGRGLFYVLVMGIQRQLLTFTLADATPVRALNLPAYTTSLDFTPSGDSLLLVYPSGNALGVVDLTTSVPQLSLRPLQAPDSSHGQTPAQVRSASNGKVFIRLEGVAAGQHQLLEVDLTSGAETIRLDAGNAGVIGTNLERAPGHGFLISGDGSGKMQVYDAGTDQFGPLTALPAQALPGSVLSVGGDGQMLAFGREILGPDLQPLRSVHSVIGNTQTGSFLSPDGQSLYYVAPQGLIRARTSDGAVVERSRLPINLPRTRISDDGQWAVYDGTSDFLSGIVGVIDLR